MTSVSFNHFSSLSNTNFSTQKFLTTADDTAKVIKAKGITKKEQKKVELNFAKRFEGMKDEFEHLIADPRSYKASFLETKKITGEAKAAVNNIFRAIKNNIMSENKTAFDAALLGSFVGTILEVSKDNSANAYEIFGEIFSSKIQLSLKPESDFHFFQLKGAPLKILLTLSFAFIITACGGKPTNEELIAQMNKNTADYIEKAKIKGTDFQNCDKIDWGQVPNELKPTLICVWEVKDGEFVAKARYVYSHDWFPGK